jgi:putative ABC transport system permease protein
VQLLINNARIAFHALSLDKLRSGLTILGVVIGVASVIAIGSIGAGATSVVDRQIAELGANVIIVQPGNLRTGGVSSGLGFAQTLTRDDAAAIAEQLPVVAAASPSVRGNAQVVFGNRNWYTRIRGSTPEFLAIRNLHVEDGVDFTHAQERVAAKVALLGQTVVRELFGLGVDPVGSVIRINRIPFTVIGTLAPKGQSSSGQDQDDTIVIPLSTAKKKVLGRNWAKARGVANIHVLARSTDVSETAEQQVRQLLRDRHELRPGERDDFQVRNLTSRLQARRESTGALSLMLTCVAAVSLLVGGIGIMNIMLVSVTQRTREIGLRQAVGAKTGHILVQFLTEAVTLSLTGGMLGMAVGAGAGALVAHLLEWPVLISAGSIVFAFVLSVLIGVFFGYYPARKAAYLNPIDAIRYE